MSKVRNICQFSTKGKNARNSEDSRYLNEINIYHSVTLTIISVRIANLANEPKEWIFLNQLTITKRNKTDILCCISQFKKDKRGGYSLGISVRGLIVYEVGVLTFSGPRQ